MTRKTFAQIIGTLVLAMAVPSSVLAASYSASTVPFSWIDPTTHTNVTWTAVSGGPPNECSGPSAAGDDDISQALNLGFSFNFAGTNFTAVRIMSNGRLQFNSTFCGYGTQVVGPPRVYPYPLPDTRLRYTMRIYGADLDPSVGGTVRYASLGTAPNRYFVVTWSSVREWNAASSNFNLQVIIYEDGTFRYQFGAIANPTQGHAQIGWQADTDDYAMYPYGAITSLQNTAILFNSSTPSPVALYSLDELSWNGSAGEIRDSAGGNHGTAVGGAQTVPNGYVCRGGQISGNNSAIDTGSTVNSLLGNRGTITFWYNNDSSWSSGNGMLVDASNNLGNNNADKYFFLSRQSGGNLTFTLEDSNDTDLIATTGNNNFAANTWHHISITWDLTENTNWLQIYIDGVRRATNRGDLGAPLNITGVLGNLNSLFFGDNRDNGIGGGGGYSSSPGTGIYDEIYLFDDVLSAAQINVNLAATHACLIGSWYMDEATWNGTANEVADNSGNGYHGTSTNGAITSIANPAIAGNPGTCYYGAFDGNDDYIALTNFPNLTDSFTITAWINPTRVDQDQRIFADDQSNTGGYAFSLGDGGDGRLRFFSRNISPVSLDSPAVISPGTWYHVAAVHNATARTRQLFVNGVAVTSAQVYSGSWGTDTGVASIGGETNAAGSEAVPNWRFTGSIDEVRVYGRALSPADITSVMNETRACPVAFDHLRIEHDGTALTCEPETVTVRACLNASCTSSYTGDVSVTLSPSGWTGGDTQIVSGGVSSFILPRRTAGAVALGISSASPYPSNGIRCLNTATSVADCTLTYHDTGFIYTIPTQTSCTTSGSITMRAVRLDNTSQACIPTFVGQTRNVVFSLNYASPASGTRALDLNYAGTNYSPITNTTSQTVPITFDASGQATFTLAYPDAGQITLNSQYLGSVGTGDDGLVMNGSSTFVTVPYKLFVFSNDANSDCPGGSDTCTAFRRAAEPFNLSIRAACADNSVTPNFQLNGLTLTHQNVAPAIAQGTLAVSSFNVAAVDNGEYTISNQSVSEVGAYTFTAGTPVSGYFGETIGDASRNTSIILGRFYPSHFCLGAVTLTPRTDSQTASGCTDNFNYLDEDFSLSIPLSAQSFGSGCAPGGITQNYTGAWSKFTSPFSENTSNPNETGKWNFAAVDSPATSATNLNSRIEINTTVSSGTAFTNGQLNIAAVMNIDRAGSAPAYTAEIPFADVHIAFNPLDSDAVAIDSTDLAIAGDNYRDLATTNLFFGRLFAENAYGSNDASLPLDMYARSEYCTAVSSGVCTNWQHATNDSCTLYNIAAPAGVSLGQDSASIGTPGYYQRASASVTSSVFNFNEDGAAPDYARVHVPDNLNHSAGWRLFYTAGGDGGDFIIPFRFPFNSDPAVHPYLLHVNGIASFGQFRGDDRIIFWREVLE